MATETRVWPDIAIPPGEVLAETLEARGMSQAELARRAGRPVQAINEIVKGAKEITPETALQLERVLGVSAHVWARLEADYRFNLARLEDQTRLQQEVPSARKYPYAAMARLGWLAEVRGWIQRVQQLLLFFGVASLEKVVDAHAAAYRRSVKIVASPESLAAWLRAGELLAEKVETRPFDEGLLRQSLREIRSLTMLPVECLCHA